MLTHFSEKNKICLELMDWRQKISKQLNKLAISNPTNIGRKYHFSCFGKDFGGKTKQYVGRAIKILPNCYTEHLKNIYQSHS